MNILILCSENLSEFEDLNKLILIENKTKFIFSHFNNWNHQQRKEINNYFKQENSFDILIDDNLIETRIFY
jgi:hypothetical protein